MKAHHTRIHTHAHTHTHMYAVVYANSMAQGSADNAEAVLLLLYKPWAAYKDKVVATFQKVAEALTDVPDIRLAKMDCRWGVLQCVAVWCSVLQCVAVCCSVLQCVAVCCSVLQCMADYPTVPVSMLNSLQKMTNLSIRFEMMSIR